MGPGELAFFLEGRTLQEAKECFGGTNPWWAAAAVAAEADKLLVSPGTGPKWYCTPWGATQCLTWMLATKVAA